MVQVIQRKPSIFGALGKGLGEGIANQVPKEIERQRLAGGLKTLGEKKGLTPFQQFGELSAIPGVTPQMIQSGSDLLRQQARGQALADFQNQPKPSPFTPQSTAQQGQGNKPPSITQEEPLAQIQEGAIPPTKDQEFARAGQLYNENPERFGNDPQKALDYVENETIRNQAINTAYEKKHENLNRIQDNVVNRLQGQAGKLKVQVPAELYSQIEDEAIQATKSKKEGGRGLTEQQAIKEFGEKLNDASRDFEKINEIGGLGGWGVALRPAQESLRSLKELQGKMEKLQQTDNFAKELQSSLKITPKLSYAIAQPVSKIPGLNSFIKTLPEIEKIETLAGGATDPRVSIPKTLDIAPQLAKFVKENSNASPLAIAYELDKKGYDSSTWLQYLTDHPELNLKQRQGEQASTPINPVAPWNDWWLSSFSGL